MVGDGCACGEFTYHQRILVIMALMASGVLSSASLCAFSRSIRHLVFVQHCFGGHQTKVRLS